MITHDNREIVAQLSKERGACAFRVERILCHNGSKDAPVDTA
jgi:hypothetical protein